MVVIKRNLKGALANEVATEFEQMLNENVDIKENRRCPKSSYEEGTFKCDPSMSKATKNTEAKETAKKGLDKDKDLTLREKTLKSAKTMMGDLADKYNGLKKEYDDKKKGMRNPDSPRNKKVLRDIEKKMKLVGGNMDNIQKAIDKNSREFNIDKKKPGDGAMKKIATKAKTTATEKVAPTKDLESMSDDDLMHGIYSPSSDFSKEEKDAAEKIRNSRSESRKSQGVSSDLKSGVATNEEFKSTFAANSSFHQEIDKRNVDKYITSMGEYNEFDPVKVNKNIPSFVQADDVVKIGRENSPVIYVDRPMKDVVSEKALKSEVRKTGKRMKADEMDFQIVGDVARIRFWWD